MPLNVNNNAIGNSLDMVEVVGSSPISPTTLSQPVSANSIPRIKPVILQRICRLFTILALFSPLPVHADAIGNAIVSAVVNAMQKSDSSPSDDDD